MKNAEKNIVVLADYIKSREPLELKDIEDFIAYEQRELRELDKTFSVLLKKKRKLRDTEKLREELAVINGRLLEASDWLQDEPVNAGDIQKTQKIEELRKLSTQLLARSEITRKSLVDDMASSRFYEQRWLPDPAKFISLVVLAPVGIAAFIEKFITDKNHVGIHVGELTIAVGLYLTFKNQADGLLKTAKDKIKKTPASMRALAVASTLEMSVRAMPLNEIEPRFPKVRARQDTVMIELKR